MANQFLTLKQMRHRILLENPSEPNICSQCRHFRGFPESDGHYQDYCPCSPTSVCSSFERNERLLEVKA